MRDRYATVADLSSFDEVIDVRTPAEFALDHIPGATNAPVLSNEERVVIGTMYRTEPFAATRLGAAMVAHNIGQHLSTLFAERPASWRPVIYCWRGGKRSGAMTTWFNLIGWRAQQLAGGYKSYRKWVLEQMDLLPLEFEWQVLRGLTGCGKTRLLHQIGAAGGQIIDLESLARHRGSLLGHWPGQTQPSQKAFDTALVEQLRGLSRSRPVFIEAESRAIGAIRLSDSMLGAIRHARAVDVSAALELRLAFLKEDYAPLFDDPASFKARLDGLRTLHGHTVVNRWHSMIDQRDIDGLFMELMQIHYDPAYRRSLRRDDASHLRVEVTSLDLTPLARRLLAAPAAGLVA